MSRLIFVPQFPQKLRYQEWFYSEFPNKLKNHFDEIIILGKDYINNNDYSNNSNPKNGMFSSIENSISFEQIQIIEYLNLDVKKDDYLLLMDLSFPGFFTNVLYHKKPDNCYAYCHASSKNNLDYFEPVRNSKFVCETGHAKLFNKIFVGSKYHKRKLGTKWNNTVNVGLPIPPFQTFKEEKKYDIISVVRMNKQKIDENLENLIERNFSNIVRKNVESWEEYYKFLSSGKVLLITTKEETFGYSALEAIMNNTIVIAPDAFSYPELLPKSFLYDDPDTLEMKLWLALNGDLECPRKILCQDLCENFYNNIINQMKG